MPPPFAASRLSKQSFYQLKIKLLGLRAIDYRGIGGGLTYVQALKDQYQEYVSPRATNQGFVKFEDFLIEDKVVVVKNQRTLS